MNSNKKSISMMGMARRAGQLSMGHDMAMKSVMEKEAAVVFFASDSSQRLVDEFEHAIEKVQSGIKCIRLSITIDEVHFALGYKAGVFTVNDKNFSNRIIELLSQEENEYDN